MSDLNAFAALIDRLAYEPGRNAKIALLGDYLRRTPDPERGFALAAITGALTFPHAKAGLIRTLIAERTDPGLFALSYDYVGDLSETVALMWPARVERRSVGMPPSLPSPTRGERRAPDDRLLGPESETDATLPPPSRGREGGHPGKEQHPAPPGIGHNQTPPTLAEIVTALAESRKGDLPGLLAGWLDGLDETGRWALLKLITGALRIGVSARLAKTAVAALGGLEPDAVEEVWHGLAPPYEALFAWVEGRAPRPEARDPAPFRPPMLAHPLDDTDFDTLDPEDFIAEWKWDGIRVQAVSGRDAEGRRVSRLYSRTGEDISAAFPDLVEVLAFDGALDGELLVVRDGEVQAFNVLQQRLNRKTVTAKLLAEFPAHIRAYDVLADGDADLRTLPVTERRAHLEACVARIGSPRIDVSPLIPFASWDALAAARAEPASVGAGTDTDAIEGCMLKRRDAPYLPGRPKGLWFKWKRDPRLIDCVLMYAQRGHGRRSSFYSDFTFGCWRDGPMGDELAPVGKAYFGFTDAELAELDRFVRKNTTNRFGPVREVTHSGEQGLVLEIAFEGLQRSTRHKSGVAMRFPRINRIRWDKPPREADRLETLEAMLVRASSG